jgi:hypothetical protein
MEPETLVRTLTGSARTSPVHFPKSPFDDYASASDTMVHMRAFEVRRNVKRLYRPLKDQRNQRVPS